MYLLLNERMDRNRVVIGTKSLRAEPCFDAVDQDKPKSGIGVKKGMCSLQRCDELFSILDLIRMGPSILFWVGAL